MPRLPGCLFKFIQKQPPDTRGVHSRQLASLSDWWCGVQENWKGLVGNFTQNSQGKHLC